LLASHHEILDVAKIGIRQSVQSAYAVASVQIIVDRSLSSSILVSEPEGAGFDVVQEAGVVFADKFRAAANPVFRRLLGNAINSPDTRIFGPLDGEPCDSFKSSVHDARRHKTKAELQKHFF